MADLNGKIVLITAAAQGIGRASVDAFVRAGATVIATDINAEKLMELDGTPNVTTRVLDVLSTEAVNAAVAGIGRIDVLFNCAGVVHSGTILEATDADLDFALDLNLKAQIRTIRAVLPQMLERGEGYLVNTASAAGLLSQVDSALYSVTKHAAVSYAEWLSINYGDRGIRVSCLCPQGVQTPMLMGQSGDRKSFLLEGAVTAEQVAEDVLQCMREERFLVLPHPEVLQFMQRKTGDYDRWLKGMRKLRAKAEAISAQNG